MAALNSSEPVHTESWHRFALYRWWRRAIVGRIDHSAVVDRIVEESGWTPRYAFMTMMSAGIAVLGLLLSSPAVVIGAMLISPLMNPILGLGFSLALFDFAEMRRSLVALVVGSIAAIAFTALIVAVSPLQATTPEIVSRTRPNLFDLAIAMFAALAGSFAIIRGRGDTIVGVAIATALMPPLAVVGYGVATWNLPVLFGSLALFVTNFVTIALAATIMARFYGFGHHLSSQQTWTQTAMLLLGFAIMAVPLGISLRQIASEAVATKKVRSMLAARFGDTARITQLDIDFDARPIVVRAVVITPRDRVQKADPLQADVQRGLERPVRLKLDQVLLQAGAGALDAQRQQLQQASEADAAETRTVDTISTRIAAIAGVRPDAVTIDRDHHRASANAAVLPGATLATYRTLESRAAADDGGWSISIVPPIAALPPIRFADNSDTLDASARDAVATAIWAAKRWNSLALLVPGLAPTPPKKPNLSQRRGAAIAALLSEARIRVVPAPPEGQAFRLRLQNEGQE